MGAFPWVERGKAFLRAGKVSKELPVQACLQTGDEMRTRPRLSDESHEVVGEAKHSLNAKKKQAK